MLIARMWGKWRAHTSMTGTWIRTSAYRQKPLSGPSEPAGAQCGGERRKEPNGGAEIGEGGEAEGGDAARKEPKMMGGKSRR